MNKEILDRFYAGQCSAEEVQAVLYWFKANDLDPAREEELYDIWRAAGQDYREELTPASAEMIFSKISQEIDRQGHSEKEEPAVVVRPLKPVQVLYWSKVAAAVLLPLCLIGALLLHTSRSKTATPAFMSVAAAPGVRKTVNLSDGSVIKLNAGSRVTFRKGFKGDTREVTLVGEAFFEVAKDSLRPFIVHTGSIATQALGTSFNIDYSLQDNTVAVALATGLVKVEKREQGLTQQLSRLVPGQQLLYSKASQQYKVSAFDKNEVLGWTRGVLHFNRADRDQVFRELENWYGVEIEVDTSGTDNNAWNYIGEYHNESLDKVLEGIGFVKGFTYKRTDKNVKIMFNQP